MNQGMSFVVILNSMNRVLQMKLYYTFSILFLVFFCTSICVAGKDFATVASPVAVVGNVNNHDIISYNSTDDTYIPSRHFADESMLGVVVDDPVFYMGEDATVASSVRPVIRFGEAIVNVSTVGGEIKAGDIITTSEIPGNGQRADKENTPYILGFALDNMVLNGGEITYGGKNVKLGTVSVALRIGPYITKEGAKFITTGKEELDTLTNVVNEGGVASANVKNIGPFKVFRFLLAAIVAISSIIISITRFGDAFREGVVSIGRNPLARSQIHSVLLWNTLLIILVSGVGLSVAVAIILFP